MFNDFTVLVFHIQKMEHFSFMKKETPEIFIFFMGNQKIGTRCLLQWVLQF